LIEAKEFREKKTLAAKVSTKLITQTQSIEDDDLRAKVIEKIQEEKVPSHEVRQFVRDIRKAPRHKREEMVIPGARITGKYKIIMHRLPRLERSVDEFAAIDSKILGSLGMDEKKQIKARLETIVERLGEVVKRI